MSRGAGHQPALFHISSLIPASTRLKLAVEHLVEAREAAVGAERLRVEGSPVYHDFLLDLLADAPQPRLLRIGPRAARQHPLHRRPDAIPIGDQRIAQGRLTHEADDGGGNVLVLGVRPGAAKVGLRVALLVEREAKLPQVGAGQVARTLHHHLQRGDGVEVVAHEGREAVEEVLRLARLAIAARDRHHLVGMVRDRDEARRSAVALPVEDGADGRRAPRTTWPAPAALPSSTRFKVASGVSPASASNCCALPRRSAS